MTLLKRITSFRYLIYISFILLHIFLLNINAAEWGDSYRILRASEYIRSDAIYPTDEKRPPLYSLILAVRPVFVDQILWGRLFMLVTSIVFLLVFEKFLKLFIKNDKYINLGLVLLALNPVFLYWSIRIYADVFFALLVLISFYLFSIWNSTISKDNISPIIKIPSIILSFKKPIILGMLSGLAVLTRFEGYLLFGSIGLGLLLLNISKKDTYLSILKRNFLTCISYTLAFITILLPWFYYRNPLTGSSYFEEPSGRSYDLKMISTYVLSFLLIFGFTSAFYFISKNYKNVFKLFFENIALSVFVTLELLLILMWPAAVPRLFVPIIPVFILILTQSIERFFESETTKRKEKLFTIDKVILFNILLLAIYIIGQYILKLQFLVPTKILFLFLVVVQLPIIYFTYIKNFKYFVISILVSSFVWSLIVIWIHKDTFISIKHAAEYVSENIEGVVAYNDVSSVSDWYLNQRDRSLNSYKGEYNDIVSGYFYNFEKNALLTQESLVEKGMDYLLITNEHNTTMDIDLEKRPYLTLIEEFSYNVNGKVFTSRVVKLNKEFKK